MTSSEVPVSERSMRARYDAAQTFPEFLDAAASHATQWRDTYRLVKVPEEATARARALAGRYHLLVLSEDWCGDAINTIPLLARLAELAPGLDLRVLGRDANPDLMDAHLTGTARAIPVVMVFDEHFRELGWWGPRPRELQAWTLDEGRTLEKSDRYRQIRTWYARDRGRSTTGEVLAIVERGETQPGGIGAGV